MCLLRKFCRQTVQENDFLARHSIYQEALGGYRGNSLPSRIAANCPENKPPGSQEGTRPSRQWPIGSALSSRSPLDCSLLLRLPRAPPSKSTRTGVPKLCHARRRDRSPQQSRERQAWAPGPIPGRRSSGASDPRESATITTGATKTAHNKRQIKRYCAKTPRSDMDLKSTIAWARRVLPRPRCIRTNTSSAPKRAAYQKDILTSLTRISFESAPSAECGRSLPNNETNTCIDQANSGPSSRVRQISASQSHRHRDPSISDSV